MNKYIKMNEKYFYHNLTATEKDNFEIISTKEFKRIQDKHTSLLVNKLKGDKYFENIFGIEFSDEQLKAIVTNDNNTYIIASAGSGKTTVLIAKVYYLIKYKKINPKKIMVTSYTNEACKELKLRFNKIGISDVSVNTINKYGYDIIMNHNKKKILKDKNNVWNIIFGSELIKNKSVLEKIFKELLYTLPSLTNIYELILEFQKNKLHYFKNVYRNHLEEKSKSNEYITLSGDKVKSRGEQIIANFLFEYNIDFIYEKKFSSDEYPNNYFKTDFYLKDYDVYWEHWGVDNNNQVPDEWYEKSVQNTLSKELYLKFEQDEKNPYLRNMKIKKKIYKKKNLKLFETSFGELISINGKQDEVNQYLSKKLSNFGIKNSKLDEEKLLKKILSNAFSPIKNEIIDVCEKIKKLKMDRTSFLKLNSNNLTLANLVYDILDQYNLFLYSNNLIDFSDQLILSTEILNKNKQFDRYEYLLIDEYQDIDKITLDFINACRSSEEKTSLIAIGDDYQSIYGFKGSDPSFFIDSSDLTLPRKEIFLNTNYRSNQAIINLAEKFINLNENKINKKSVSFESKSKLNLSCIYTDKEHDVSKLKRNLKKDLDFFYLTRSNKFNNQEKILESLIECIKNSNYSRLKPIIKQLRKSDSKSFELVHGLLDNAILSKNSKISTIHKSKGLETDWVILSNPFYARYRNDSLEAILNLTDEEKHIEEERRILYVAITRAKKGIILIIDEYNKININNYEIIEMFNETTNL